ncbi:sensor histidine kinase [Sphingomonas crusticola]|uniref:sensor histidine kinase n=1 Tax=Sphingomonas crusticola TaxID=1697973 RepID=UPI000E236BA8|nr:sensor histidine kinase [Sphingomonas crusticola]
MNFRSGIRPRLPASIFERLRLLLAILFGGGALAALAAAWLFAISAASEAYDRLLISAAVQIAESIEVEDRNVIVTPPDSAFETLALSENDRFFYSVRDPAGRLLTGEADLLPEGRPRGGALPRLHSERYAGARVRVARIDHFVAAPGVRGWSRVVVAETREARQRMAVHLMEKIGGIILLVSGLGLAGALIAIRRAFMPLHRIEHALADRQAHDLTPLKVDSPRETVGLIRAINDVMEKLSLRMARLQAFTAVAAHQIRTPLAALGAQAELLAQDRTSVARRERIQRVQANVAKLSRVTNQLLGQAMISYRSETAPRIRLDLADLVRSVVNESIPHSLDRDLAVDCHSDVVPTQFVGDGVSLREAVANLIDNAVAHGAPSEIRIGVGASAAETWIRVADDGPGFPPEHWQAAQEPFKLARADREGAGMGISIVSEIARAHNGRIEFGYAADGFFQATLIFADGPRLA